MPYVPGDRHRAVRDFVRVHRPSCIAQKGQCGCSEKLVPQPFHYYINDVEVTEQEYAQAQAEYRKARAAGLV